MTLAQIAAIIGLLLSFGVSQPEADNVQAILMHSPQVQVVAEGATVLPEQVVASVKPSCTLHLALGAMNYLGRYTVMASTSPLSSGVLYSQKSYGGVAPILIGGIEYPVTFNSNAMILSTTTKYTFAETFKAVLTDGSVCYAHIEYPSSN